MKKPIGIEDLLRMHDTCLENFELSARFQTESWSERDDYLIFYLLGSVYKPDDVIECGTCAGMSAMVWALTLSNSADGRVHTFDTRRCPALDEGSELSSLIRRYYGLFSELVLEVMRSLSGRRLIYIDGDHRKSGVSQDIAAIRPHLRRGDLIIFHDVRLFPHIDRLANNFFATASDTFLVPTRLGIRVVLW